MERYLINFNTKDGDNSNYDVLIIGGGIGGLYTALCLPEKLHVAVVCKGPVDESNSYLAQGGIAASIGDDDRELHIKDTMVAGAFENDEDAVRVLVEESQGVIEDLINLGVPFDRDENGNLYKSLEGGHSIPRVLHVHGDATGKGVMDTLIEDARQRKNIDIFENLFAVDILTGKNRCIGAILSSGGHIKTIWADFVVMATGGIGQLYAKTTNSRVLTGDGIAMAIRAGAKIDDMEYIQFHPTALYSKKEGERLFLISEAVRGEGGILRNIHGERFMDKYDERMELAPRDIVARAIFDQMRKTQSDFVYLDVTHLSRDFLKTRFPTIYETCRHMGIDMAEDYIPVTPVVHYFMGGIKTDTWGRTSLDRLYAVGECACTGVHGANRLASNSLLEGLVFGKRIAQDIAKHCETWEVDGHDKGFQEIEFKAERVYNTVDFDRLKNDLKKIMLLNVGIIRNEDDLKKALDFVKGNMELLDKTILDEVGKMETANMYLVASYVIEGALKNKKSAGSHYIQSKVL